MRMAILLFLFFFGTSPMMGQSTTYQLSGHFLNINQGGPAKGITVELFKGGANDTWELVETVVTDSDGRFGNLLDAAQNNNGIYRLRINTGAYQRSQRQRTVHPFAEVNFEITDKKAVYLTMTLAGNGYTVNGYRR